MQHDWTDIINQIEKSQRILLTTHIHPDGDGLGSEAAMYYILKSLGKLPYISNISPLPPEYEFLNQGNIFHQFDAERDQIDQFDLALVLDIGAISRLGRIGDKIREQHIPTICIDHHPIRDASFDREVVDTSVSATAILIYEFIQRYHPCRMDKTIATALYTGILTDTGGFRFDNTDVTTMQIGADLIATGIKPGYIYREVYENRTPTQVKLMGMVLQDLEYELEGKLAWFTITRQLIRKAGSALEEVDGFTDLVRSIRGVEVAVMFLEVRDRRTRLNFRSKGKVIINGLAKQFQGGGHPFAAGAIMDLSVTQARKKVLPAVRRLIA